MYLYSDGQHCVCCVYCWGVHVAGQKSVLDVFFYCCPLYCFETEFLTEPGAHWLARWVGQWAPGIDLPLTHPNFPTLGFLACVTMLRFYVDFGDPKSGLHASIADTAHWASPQTMTNILVILLFKEDIHIFCFSYNWYFFYCIYFWNHLYKEKSHWFVSLKQLKIEFIVNCLL